MIDLLPSLSGNATTEYGGPGKPLVITFGFYADPNTAPANFEFQGRLKKLELISGRELNKLFLRDPSMRWYLAGIDGISEDVASTAAAIRDFVERAEATSVTVIGQSMGAYAAILFGTLIGADKVISFGPLSCFDRRTWSLMNETRWVPPLDALEASGVDAAGYTDLPSFLASHDGPLPDIDLIYGAWAGPGTNTAEVTAIDSAHAVRFVNTPAVRLLPVHHAQHAVVEHFRAGGVITEVLAHRMFGDSLLPTLQRITGDQWVGWLLENVMRGSTFEQLLPVMGQQMPIDQVQHRATQAKLILDLSAFEELPPAVTVGGERAPAGA
ncbi:MAG: hypothetical protein AAGC46_11945 [Solirubrobacteraceae bacterium]|nr:hypothetical protein [Patulibacter sp.]